MRMLDADKEASVFRLQLYLSVQEASELRKELDRLLKDPEASEHIHVFDHDMSRELSCSIVTPRKLERGAYTELEEAILYER